MAMTTMMIMRIMSGMIGGDEGCLCSCLPAWVSLIASRIIRLAVVVYVFANRITPPCSTTGSR